MNGVAICDLRLYHEAQNELARARRASKWKIIPENVTPINIENSFFDIPDDKFVQLFGINKDLARYVITQFEPHITPGRFGLGPTTKIFSVLNFLTTGRWDMSHIGTVAQQLFLKEVLDAAKKSRFIEKNTKFPQKIPEINAKQRDFYEKYKFSGIIGCVDCMQFPYIDPSRQDPIKGFFNLQLICDANMKIMSPSVKFKGRLFESLEIWDVSPVKLQMQRLHELYPNEYHLLGNFSYLMTPWMLLPKIYSEPNTPEHRYTEMVKTIIANVEQVSGMLKAKFRCLSQHGKLPSSHSQAANIIFLCCALHNLCIDENLPQLDHSNNPVGSFKMIGSDSAIEDDWENPPNPHSEGLKKQDYIIRNYFT